MKFASKNLFSTDITGDISRHLPEGFLVLIFWRKCAINVLSSTTEVGSIINLDIVVCVAFSKSLHFRIFFGIWLINRWVV